MLSHKFIFLLNAWNNYIFSKIKLWKPGKKNHHFENPLTIFYKIPVNKMVNFFCCKFAFCLQPLP
jgi:hypothetical protein